MTNNTIPQEALVYPIEKKVGAKAVWKEVRQLSEQLSISLPLPESQQFRF